jgi:hypothetical protein
MGHIPVFKGQSFGPEKAEAEELTFFQPPLHLVIVKIIP